jgi:hypothetical protein
MPRGVRVVPAAWPTTVVHALLLAAAAFVVLAPDAAAQTTVTLTTGTGLTDDVTIRGGGYAAVNYGASDELTTKQDSDPSYDRRALLKFDTQTTIPAGTAISSAHLYLTLKSPGGPTNRTLTAYRVTKSFLEREASWYNYRLGGAWASPGGDLAETFGTAAVGSVAGTVVDFDVTELVRRTVHGDFGSRYTRLALVDGGSALDDSYRGFWSSRASDTSKHPRLVITYGASDTTAPAVAVTSPAQGTTVSGSVALAASASDNVGVASVQFRVNGSNVGAADSSSPYTASWNTTGLAAGTYTVTALATDAAGNSTTSAGVSVTIGDSGVVTNARSVTFSSSSQNATMADGRPVVSSYRLEIWTAGSNTATGTPYRTSDMGKPSTSSTTLTIDQSTFFAGLARNQQFIATVSAIGPGGTARSDPSNVFVMP